MRLIVVTVVLLYTAVPRDSSKLEKGDVLDAEVAEYKLKLTCASVTCARVATCASVASMNFYLPEGKHKKINSGCSFRSFLFLPHEV